jgi:hypothetical protein
MGQELLLLLRAEAQQSSSRKRSRNRGGGEGGDVGKGTKREAAIIKVSEEAGTWAQAQTRARGGGGVQRRGRGVEGQRCGGGEVQSGAVMNCRQGRRRVVCTATAAHNAEPKATRGRWGCKKGAYNSALHLRQAGSAHRASRQSPVTWAGFTVVACLRAHGGPVEEGDSARAGQSRRKWSF